jgi:Protein of unknown function (DUF3309)
LNLIQPHNVAYASKPNNYTPGRSSVASTDLRNRLEVSRTGRGDNMLLIIILLILILGFGYGGYRVGPGWGYYGGGGISLILAIVLILLLLKII